jgi:hypothetical protein
MKWLISFFRGRRNRTILASEYRRILFSVHFIIISIQPLGQFWQKPEPSQATGMALARCILSKFLGVVCHYFLLPLDVPTFAARGLHIPNNASAPSNERWKYGREWCLVILPKWCLFTPFRDLLHAANLRHGTDGFTSPPKEGMLKTASAGFEPVILGTRGQHAIH